MLSAKDFDEIFEQSKHKRENAPRSPENDRLSATMNLIGAVYSQTLIMLSARLATTPFDIVAVVHQPPARLGRADADS